MFRKTLRREHAESMRRGARELNRDHAARTAFQIGVDLKYYYRPPSDDPSQEALLAGIPILAATFQAETQRSTHQGAPNFITKHTLRSKVRLFGEDSPQTQSVNQYEPLGLGPFAAATPPPPAALIVVIVIILVAIVLCQRRRWCPNYQCHRLGRFRRHADCGHIGSETKSG
jgi:hypothetical protein